MTSVGDDNQAIVFKRDPNYYFRRDTLNIHHQTILGENIFSLESQQAYHTFKDLFL